MGQAIQKFSTPPGVEPQTFRNVINAAYTAWIGNQKHRLPAPDDVAVYCSHQRGTIAKIMETREFHVAITDRGVPWEEDQGLTAKQHLALSVMTDPTDRRTPAVKLKAVGVTYPQYRAWMKNPLFANALQRITEGMINDHLADMQTALTNKAINGDLNAIKFAYELTGKHDPAQKEVIQLRALVQMLLEVLTKHLSGQPEVLQAVAMEIQSALPKALVQGDVLR